MKKEETCENCRFYHAFHSSGDEGRGECRRYSPKVYPVNEIIKKHYERGSDNVVSETKEIGNSTLFPKVFKGKFCGEFKKLN